jgi:DNA-binding transcriptional MocR family regulator
MGSLPIQLDRDRTTPLAAQIYSAIREGIENGRLASGARLPSWQDLAAQLGVSRGTVRVAYPRLPSTGRGGVIRPVAKEVRAAAVTAGCDAHGVELERGRLDAETIILAASISTAVSRQFDDPFGRAIAHPARPRGRRKAVGGGRGGRGFQTAV